MTMDLSPDPSPDLSPRSCGLLSPSPDLGDLIFQLGLGALAKEAMRITWVGVWLNLALSGAKGVGGVVFNSSSLLADAGHSFSDLLSDFVTLASVKIAGKVCGPPHRTPQDTPYLPPPRAAQRQVLPLRVWKI